MPSAGSTTMALRLFRLQREPQPGPTPGPASAPATPDPTRIAIDGPAPPRIIHAKAATKARVAKKAKAKPRATKKR